MNIFCPVVLEVYIKDSAAYANARQGQGLRSGICLPSAPP